MRALGACGEATDIEVAATHKLLNGSGARGAGCKVGFTAEGVDLRGLEVAGAHHAELACKVACDRARLACKVRGRCKIKEARACCG